MSEDTPNVPSVTTAAQFNDALTALLLTAFENGVDVCGAWECRTNDAVATDWEAMIVELAAEDQIE
jgi:hypothetical protein